MAKPDFQVDVEGIGQFTFRRRTIRDQMRIEGEVNRILGGSVTDNITLSTLSLYYATVSVLTVQAPTGWDMEEMDPLDDATFSKIADVFRSLRTAEEKFRAGG